MKMKRVIIMQGIPGSGKSTWIIQNLVDTKHLVVSADHFRVDSCGVYHFDATNPQVAHGKCLLAFIEACAAGVDTIVVDNTNTTAVEIAPYHAIAQAYHYDVKIVRIVADPAICVKRNIHGVPAAGIDTMAERLAGFRSMPQWTVEVKDEEKAA